MTQQRSLSASEYRCHPLAAPSDTTVPKAVDASMQLMKPPRLNPTRDRSAAQASRKKLLPRQYAMLLPCQGSQPSLPLGQDPSRSTCRWLSTHMGL
jgi:hypothetical protein